MCETVGWKSKPKRYSSILGVKTGVLERIDKCFNSENIVWVGEEKVHGSNLGIHYNNGSVRFASRNLWIEDTQKFHNLNLIQDDLKRKITELSKILNKDYIIIYGEICGNGYPGYKHEDYNFKPVQKGVYYSYKPEFYAFDIYIDGKYLNYDERNRCLDSIELFRGQEIIKGSLKECLKYDVETFQTTLPERLRNGCNSIPDNYSEGLVIRPIKELRFEKGDRTIIKYKRKGFSEINLNKEKSEKSCKFPKEIEELLNKLSRYITLNRLNNVKSHEINCNNKIRLCGLLVQDATKEFERDNDCDIKEIILDVVGKTFEENQKTSEEKTLKKNINKELQQYARKVVFNS